MSKLLKNSFLYTAGNILPQAAGFILLPIYTAYLDPDQYGIVNSMTVLSTVFGFMLTFGIDRGIYRLYYDYEPKQRKEYLGTMIIGITLFSLSIFTIALLIPETISSIYKSISFYPYYFLMLLYTLFAKTITIPGIYLRVSEQAGRFVILNVALFLITVFFNLLFIVHFKQGAVGMLKGTLIANIVMAPVFYMATYKAIKFRFKINYFIESIKFSLPLLPGLIFAWVLNLSDRIFLERFLSISDVGIYSLGYKIASVVTVVSSGLFAAYNPYFYKLANEGGADVKKKIGKFNNTIVIIMLAICFLLALFSKEIITLFISDEYNSAAKIIPLLTLGIFFSQINGFASLMIYQEKKSIQIMLITFSGALINVISNIILIPLFGMIGAALATLISFLALFVIQYNYARKCFFIPLNWSVILPSLIACIATFIGVEMLHIQHWGLALLIKALVTLVFFVVIYIKYKEHIKMLFVRR